MTLDRLRLGVIERDDGLVPHQSTRKYLTQLFGVDWDAFDSELEQTTIYESLKWLDRDTRQPGTPGTSRLNAFLPDQSDLPREV